MIQCPPIVEDCSLPRIEGQSLVDYKDACATLKAELAAAKALEEEGDADEFDGEDEDDTDLEEIDEGEGW